MAQEENLQDKYPKIADSLNLQVDLKALNEEILAVDEANPKVNESSSPQDPTPKEAAEEIIAPVADNAEAVANVEAIQVKEVVEAPALVEEVAATPQAEEN